MEPEPTWVENDELMHDDATCMGPPEGWSTRSVFLKSVEYLLEVVSSAT